MVTISNDQNEENMRSSKNLSKKSANIRNRATGKFQNFTEFVWNSKQKSVLGRDGRSWGLISLYYAGFYVFLFAYFAAIFAVYHASLDKHLPNFYNVKSVMDYAGVNPGLGFRPHGTNNPGIIVLDDGDKESAPLKAYKDYVQNYLIQNFTVTNADKFRKDCLKNVTQPLEQGYVCNYDFASLITQDNDCHYSNGASYKNGSLCVIIKLNRIIGWVPRSGPNGLPPNVNDTDGFVYFQCSGVRAADKDNFKVLKYYYLGNSDGNQDFGRIPFSYFPYFNAFNYVPAFVVVKFGNITRNTAINVACLAYSDNIDHSSLRDLSKSRGMARFQLFYNSAKV